MMQSSQSLKHGLGFDIKKWRRAVDDQPQTGGVHLALLGGLKPREK